MLVNRRASTALPTAVMLFVLLLFSQFGATLNVSATKDAPSPRQNPSSLSLKGNSVSNTEATAIPAAAAPAQLASGSISPLTAPKVVQTQDYDFRITTHEITTSFSYVYVTSAGNYSFSKLLPWSLSYTSLWGNTTSFSGYGVQESGNLLIASSPGVTAGQTSFSVNSTQISGAAAHGYLYCSYDFSKTPEKTSCNYRRIGSHDFSIVWLVTGNYVRDNNTTYQTSTQAGLTLIGDRQSAIVGSTPNSAKWHIPLKLDWTDYGLASLYYGRITFASTPNYGVLVEFPQNVAAVDPTVVQTNACYEQNTVSNGFSDSCSFSSNVTSGDLVISAIGVIGVSQYAPTGDWDIRDTAGYSFTRGVHADGTNPGVVIFYAIASSTHSETTHIVNNTDINTNVVGENYLFEVSGVSGLVDATSSGTGSCSSSCSDQAITTTSKSFPSYQFSIGLAGASNGMDGLHSLESGYTHDCRYSCDPTQASNQFEAIYSTSGVSSPTSFTQYTYNSGATNWADVGMIFASVTIPITATLNTVYGGSARTITVSGCSATPSTFPGDGSSHNIVMLPSCSFGLTLPSGYQWTTSSSSTSCSSGTCSSFSATYEQNPVTQGLKAVLSGAGSSQTVSVSGCSASPTSFPGDGSVNNIVATPSCTLTLSVPSTPTLYVWKSTDVISKTTSTCGSGTCTTAPLTYLQAHNTGIYPSIYSRTVQMGYNSNYTGSGPIGEVSTTLHNLSTMNSTSSDTGASFAQLLDTGGSKSPPGTSCEGFMQVGVLAAISQGHYDPIYMDGVNGCGGTYFTPSAGTFVPGHQVVLEIEAINSTTSLFEATDQNVTGATWSKYATNIGSWGNNTFQTMTESESSLTGVGGSTYEYSNMIASGTFYYPGGSSTTTPTSYGGVCASTPYSLEAWSTGYHGFYESSFSIEGPCAQLVPANGYGTYNNGVINSPNSVIGTPHGTFTELKGPGSTDGAYVVGDLDGTWSGVTYTIYIHAYSYSTTTTVDIYGASTFGTWSLISANTVTASSSPAWIAMGTYSSPIRYVEISVTYSGSNPADLFVDSIAIGA